MLSALLEEQRSSLQRNGSGVVTYPSGDQRQGRYQMTLTDLMNAHYTRGVREAAMD